MESSRGDRKRKKPVWCKYSTGGGNRHYVIVAVEAVRPSVSLMITITIFAQLNAALE